MDLNAYFGHDVLVWVVIPILIFIGGLSYVSIGTLRIIFVARGRRFMSPILGFFEVTIWLIAISQIMSNVSNIAAYIAYAAGFAVGNYAGIIIEEKMAIGTLIVRIILTENNGALKSSLAAAGFGVTSVEGRGAHGKVMIIFTTVRRKDLPLVIKIIDDLHENAFYTVEDARHVAEGVFPEISRKMRRGKPGKHD